MEKTIKIDFWQVSEGKNKAFPAILSDLVKLPSASRIHNSKDNPIRLSKLAINKLGLWEGDMVRIRMDYVPPKAKIAGGITPLKLANDEGIGEETAFLFDPKLNILVTQRNRYSVSANALASYIFEKAKLPDFVVFAPIIRAEAFEKLRKMTSVRKFQVNFARITNIAPLKNIDAGVGQMVSILENYGGFAGNIAVSMGHFQGELLTNQIIGTAKRLLGIQSTENQVSKIIVNGRDENNVQEILDLLDYRLVKEKKFEVDRRLFSITLERKIQR